MSSTCTWQRSLVRTQHRPLDTPSSTLPMQQPFTAVTTVILPRQWSVFFSFASLPSTLCEDSRHPRLHVLLVGADCRVLKKGGS